MIYFKSKNKKLMTKKIFRQARGKSKNNNLVGNYFEEKGLPLRPALTFDDVQIINNISDISSRSDIKNLKTPLRRSFFLNIPIVSANMDTVTESEMAIAMAK